MNSLDIGSYKTEAGGEKQISIRINDENKKRDAEHRDNNNVRTWKCALVKVFPVVQWLPEYRVSEYLTNDFIAGFTVCLTAIPQSIAYAVVAGLPPQYGLYASIASCCIYVAFGNSKDVTIGPTAIMALMTRKLAIEYGPDFAILLTFLSGLVVLALSFLQLGFLVEFISLPVIAGFTSAAACIIATSQIKSFLGITIAPKASDKGGFLESWANIITNLPSINWYDATLGIVTVLLLLIGRILKNKSSKIKMKTWYHKWIAKFLKIVGLASNALVVIGGSLLAYVLFQYDKVPFKLIGEVVGGLPALRWPPFEATVGEKTVALPEMISIIGTSVLTVPFISIMETIAIAKAFDKGKGIDAGQEMVALGMCNVLGAFICSMPVSGSFTRTAINNTCGVMTPFSGIFTGILILLAVNYLTSLFYFIPKSTLAGLIIIAMVFMVEYHVVTLLWRTKKVDIIPLLASFFSCLLFGVEYGIVIGITSNLLIILYHSARPAITLQWVQVDNKEVLVVTPMQNLLFPASSYIREVIVNACISRHTKFPIVILGVHVHYIDSTMAKGFKLLIDDLKSRDQSVYLWKWTRAAHSTCIKYDPSMAAFFRFDGNLSLLLKG